MSEPMNKEQFLAHLKHVQKYHSPKQMLKKFGKCLKSVDPHIDLRDAEKGQEHEPELHRC